MTNRHVPPPARTLVCGDMTLELDKRTLIMGILNVTPDSFSDGGDFINPEAAIRRAREMVAEGADIIDVGGESTRPGAAKVPLETELRRVIPVIRELKRAVSVPISVDTYKAETARQALAAGAHIVNDIWGLRADPEMASVVAQSGCPVILMHNRNNRDYTDFLSDVTADLRQSVELARSRGIQDRQIVLDPGIGFAKSMQQQLYLLNHLDVIVSLGFPVLLGPSRKSVLRNTLNLPADDMIEGTAAAVALGIAQGCGIIRVHDVKQMKRVAAMTDAIIRSTDAVDDAGKR